MKTRFVKAVLTLALALLSLPMQSQDYMNIFFKDGSFRKFYMKNVTEIFASKTDAEGVVHSDYSYQHITTISDKYIYSLEDVDSITFTKRDDKIAEKNFVTAMPVVFSTIKDCEKIKDAESNIDKFKSAEGVADAWSDGHELHVAIAEGEIVSFHFNDDEEAFVGSFDEIMSEVRKASLQKATVADPVGTPLKAVIANQQHKDENRQSYITNHYNPFKEALIACGVDATYIASPTIDFFYDNCQNPDNADHLNLYDYDIAFLVTHGSYGDMYYLGKNDNGRDVLYNTNVKAHSILSSEDLLMVDAEVESSEIDWVGAYRTIRDWRDGLTYDRATDIEIGIGFCKEQRNNRWNWVGHPELTELFFRHTATGRFSNPNSIFFNTACQSLKGDDGPSFSLANRFISRGLGVYLGFSETDCTGKKSGPKLLTSMLNGLSLEKAYQSLPLYMKQETVDNYEFENESYNIDNVHGAELLYHFNPDNDNMSESLFLLPVETESVNAVDVKKENTNFYSVTLNGHTTQYRAAIANLSYGFEIGTSEQMNNDIKATYVPQGVPASPYRSVFQAIVSNVKPNQTYHYRAYTFDGDHYNFGKTYTFVIDDQEEPDEPTTDKELMLSESVDGVDYKIYKKILDALDYHENPDGWKCYRSELSLETTANGSTQTIVLDNKIYLDDSKGHHGGQYPCILIDHKKDLFIVFCNSKDADYQYSMDCYSYVSSIKTLDFHREKVLDRVNMGWYPYFEENSEGLPAVSHFSYAGYYAMQSIRNDGGAWNTVKGSKINPGDFETKSKKAGQILVIYDDGGEDNPPGGDDNPSTSCPAKITSVELINAGYLRNEEHPNRLYFNVNAKLDNLTGIEEWGVYVDYDTKVEMPFKKVESQQTKTMAYSFKQDMRNDELIVFDLDSYVVEWADEVGVYVKRRDSSSGELTTIYGDKYQFKLRYDTKPSMVLSDPVIVGTEVTGTENGYKKYKTTITYKYDLKGAFWIDYVDSAVSGGEWSFDGFDETWYPEYDHAGESEWVATYSEETSELNHTNWRRLHLRNYGTINSNYVNFTGNGTLTEAWVTSNPVYSRARSNADTTQKCFIREVMIPAAAPDVKAVTSYKGGSLGEVAE